MLTSVISHLAGKNCTATLRIPVLPPIRHCSIS